MRWRFRFRSDLRVEIENIFFCASSCGLRKIPELKQAALRPPQRLKPRDFFAAGGTTEVVP